MGNRSPYNYRKMNVIDEGNRMNMVTQGTTTVIMGSYFYSAYVAMLPWFIAAVPLILIDLRLGRKKARMKGEKVTLNKSVRMTIDKTFSYICWIMLSTTLAMAFDVEAIKYFIMGVIYGLEVISSLNSWFITKNINVDEIEMFRILLKFLWKRLTGEEEELHGVFTDMKKTSRRRNHHHPRKEEGDV